MKKHISAKEQARCDDSEAYAWKLHTAFQEFGVRTGYKGIIIQKLTNGQLISTATPMTYKEELKILFFHMERLAQEHKVKPSAVAFEALREDGHEEDYGTAEDTTGDAAPAREISGVELG